MGPAGGRAAVSSDENVDLDDGRKQEILELEAKLTSADYFDLLGLQPGTQPEEVRAAFRELSRRFHPDRYFGKNLGTYRGRLERIFKGLVEAQHTLTDPERREAYLAAHPVVRAAARASGLEPMPEIPVEKTHTEKQRDEERRARLARHPYLARHSRVQELLVRARQHVEKQEYSQAFTAINTAVQMDPQHTEAKLLLGEVRKKADANRAETHYQHALQVYEQGDVTGALQALRVAVTANPGHARAAARAAQICEATATDVREAVGFAQKAVEGDPENVEYRLLAARVLMAAGMKALAKRHFDEAAKLAPNHPEVKKQVKRLWPF